MQTSTSVAQTTNAKATTTLEDTSPAVPLPDTPQGVMVLGPQVTFNFIQEPYNQGNSYNYYDVVLVDGTSYIAVQNVPANTPITNTDYWAKWNAPNAEFEQLQDTVETFDQRIRDNADAIVLANNHISEINEKIGKKVVVLGDSWSAGTFKWLNYAVNTGYTFYNFAVSGAMVTQNAQNQLNNAVASEEFDNDEITTVLLLAGLNDFSNSSSITDSQVASAVINIYNLVGENFKNAEFIYIMNMRPIHNNYQLSWFKNVANIISYYLSGSSVAKTFRMYWTGGWVQGFSSYWYDGAHPNQNGAAQVACNIVRILNGEMPLRTSNQCRLTVAGDTPGPDVTCILTIYQVWGEFNVTNYYQLSVVGTSSTSPDSDYTKTLKFPNQTGDSVQYPLSVDITNIKLFGRKSNGEVLVATISGEDNNRVVPNNAIFDITVPKEINNSETVVFQGAWAQPV